MTGHDTALAGLAVKDIITQKLKWRLIFVQDEVKRGLVGVVVLKFRRCLSALGYRERFRMRNGS